MGMLAAIVIVGLAALAALAGFARADPRRLADSIRMVGPIVAGLAAVALLAAAKPLLGGLMFAAALGWYNLAARKRGGMLGGRRLVRTAALEMEAEPGTGKVEGLVLAGRQEGRVLGAMELNELGALWRELAADPESRKLLEAYLDRRFPVWRKDAEPDRRKRLRAAPRAGAMTKQEAYQLLGLEPGAAAADILEAHRRLMQRLDADIGDGTSVLAARLDEAKDVLLSNHD